MIIRIVSVFVFLLALTGQAFAQQEAVTSAPQSGVPFVEKCYNHFMTIPSIETKDIDGRGLCACLEEANPTIDKTIVGVNEVNAEYLKKGTPCFKKYMTEELSRVCSLVTVKLSKAPSSSFKSVNCECLNSVFYKILAEFWASLNSGGELLNMKEKSFALDEISYCLE